MAAARPDTLEAALAEVFRVSGDRASWFALTGGEPLFSVGDAADALYLVRSGRLGVFRREEGQPPRMLGVVAPGEPVGEMALFADTAHTADVVALRDTEIMAPPREAVLDAVRARPEIMIALTQLMLARARDNGEGMAGPSVFGFVAARERPIRSFVDRIAQAIRDQGLTCRVIDHSALASAADWFSRVEEDHDYVLYVAERDETSWAALCVRQVDRLFLVGDSLGVPPHRMPARGTGSWHDPAFADLILLRDPRMRQPANTSVWLDALRPGRWFQAVEGDVEDARRIARIVTGRAVGLVLSGGGARAYAHIGAIRALRQAGVTFDFLGGASMGAVVAAGPALGWTDDELEARIRRAFVTSDPLSDLAVPIIAMTRARKVAGLLQDAYGEVDIADLPLPFFAVSSNLTTGRVEVHRRGLLRRAMRASIAIPGVMPPVVLDGQVLVDGAVIKNFPTDVMRRLNAGPIIGVDMSQARGVDPGALENPPSWWRWLLSGQWKAGPPIVSILMRAATITTDIEVQRARADVDLLILPQPATTDIRDWKAYEPTVESGRVAAQAALLAHDPDASPAFQFLSTTSDAEGPVEPDQPNADAQEGAER